MNSQKLGDRKGENDSRLDERIRAAHRIIIPILAALVLAGCWKGSVVARVGSFTITRRQAELRDRVVRIYFPDEKRNMGLQQLTRAYTFAQILINNGYPLDAAAVEKEAARIDQNTQAPEMLRKIKNIFDGDPEAYRSVFVLPTLADRVIYYEFFLRNERIHAHSRREVEEFLELATKEPRGFTSLARSRGRTPEELLFTAERGIHRPKTDAGASQVFGNAAPPEAVSKRLKERESREISASSRKWLDEVIGPLKPGGVFPKVIDEGDHWLAVRYDGMKPRGVHHLTGVVFPKVSYEAWLEAEKKKIEVQVP